MGDVVPGDLNFDGVDLVRDISSAAWLTARLWAWRRNPPVRVGSMVPERYPAYGRLLHPAGSATADGPRAIRWADIAAAKGRTIDGTVRFNDVVDWDPARDGSLPPWPYRPPRDGSMGEHECRVLAEVLAGFTATPRQCWFCLWDGWDVPQLRPPNAGLPRVHGQHRNYFLFTGPVTAATSFRGVIHAEWNSELSARWDQSPSLWWPEDRAWCVGTDIDGYSTYLACNDKCLDALVHDSRVEVLPVKIDDCVDPSPWPGA